jgi:HAD superfamily hydrolase (TIGR01509 family)
MDTLKAVLFDFDGTLTKPGALDFSIIRRRIGCPEGQPILEFIEKTANSEQRKEMTRKLDQFEAEAAARSVPNAGSEELIGFLKRRHVKIAVITRNTLASVQRSMENFKHTTLEDFDFLLTREADIEPKPSPEGVYLAAEKVGVSPAECMLVGDFIFDLEAGKNAAVKTVWLKNPFVTPDHRYFEASDYIVSTMEELRQIIRMHLPLQIGKFPNDLLDSFLSSIASDTSVLIPPTVGEDAAAVKIDGEEVLVLKSDPITFATDSIGFYSVMINANDIACSGARPRWLLTTLLLPVGFTGMQALAIMEELRGHCDSDGIVLCGGHTEITDSVTRPVVVGMLVGTVAQKDLVDKRNMAPGDHVLLTKGIAVEGTALAAREFPTLLKETGLTDKQLAVCRDLVQLLSILPEAEVAANHGGVTAMHDVTEGGLATALLELSHAGHHCITVHKERIPLRTETGWVCDALGLDPMGLIGSGSLLICCKPEMAGSLEQKLQSRGIEVAGIGEVGEPGNGIIAFDNGVSSTWPQFETDEITKLFQD